VLEFLQELVNIVFEDGQQFDQNHKEMHLNAGTLKADQATSSDLVFLSVCLAWMASDFLGILQHLMDFVNNHKAVQKALRGVALTYPVVQMVPWVHKAWHCASQS